MPSSLPPFSPNNIRQPPPTAGHSHHRRKSFPATLSGELQIYSSSMDLSDPLLHAPPLILSITTTSLSPHQTPTVIIIIIVTSSPSSSLSSPRLSPEGVFASVV
ncbi:hypothetical protein Tco_0475466 [Tanacetum coccineum]